MEVVGGSAGGKKNRKNITPEELETAGVIFEERKLPVGDFLWIARSKCGSIELVCTLCCISIGTHNCRLEIMVCSPMN